MNRHGGFSSQMNENEPQLAGGAATANGDSRKTQALLVRLRPSGPWRFGSVTGEAHDVDSIYRSDSLYSAVSSAMATLGQMEEWLESTALAAVPEVRFTSCFPWQGEHLFVPPPASTWPPPSAKARFPSASFVPAGVARRLTAGEVPEEGRWAVDPPSRCLVPAARSGASCGPFRIRVRSSAAVDRLTPGRNLAHRTACVEFAPGAGLWTLATFAGEAARNRWREPVAAAFRLLADSGFGGRRSLGWGRSEQPEIEERFLEELLPLDRPLKTEPPAEEAAPGLFDHIAIGGRKPSPPPPSKPAAEEEGRWWLLSLFCPDPSDALDWKAGNYRLIVRGGRVEGPMASGEPKRLVRMIAEGGVIRCERPPRGSAPDVRPEGFPRPVLRYGHPVCVAMPSGVTA